MTIEEKNSVLADPNKRFSELQKLETIFLAAPHQHELQKLVGSSVAEAIQESGENSAEIVEIGAGKGFTSQEILQASPGAKIIGVDNDEGMLQQARENLAEYIREGQLELRQEDALEFLKKFPDDSVLIIESGFTIHNFKNDYRKAVLEEIFRILKLGGEFITADKIMPDDDEIFQREVSYAENQFQNIPDKEKRKEWMRHYEEDMHPDVIMREGELIEMLQKIGFRDINISNRIHLEALLVAKK